VLARRHCASLRASVRLWGALLRKTLVAVGSGALPGVVIALAMTRYFPDLIRGADAQMIATSGLAVATTMTVAVAASRMASRRLSRLDIMEVLRPGDGA